MIDIRVPCDCCGFLTFFENEEYELCPVCFWKADFGRREIPDKPGGANGISLNEARKNFLKFGACEGRFKEKIRKPLPEKHPKPYLASDKR